LLDLKVPTITITDKKIINIKEEEPPPPGLPFGFGFGIPSFPKARKLRVSKPRARQPARRRKYTVDPFAGLYSVHVSEFMFGKATHPARTKKEKKKFKKRIRESAMFFPTVEMEKFAVPKM